MNDLLDAVDALTKPVTSVRWQQAGHEHEWENVREYRGQGDALNIWQCQWCGETVFRPPMLEAPESVVRRRSDGSLLEQLREAVASSMESGGAGKPGRERVPIDVGALTLYESIDGRVRAWCSDLGRRVTKETTAGQALRTWYSLWIGTDRPEGLDGKQESVLSGWAQAIRDHLQPPRRIEITAPCPVCGHEWVNVGLQLADGTDDPNDIELVRTLNAVERDSLEDSYAMCRACKTVWSGGGRMRQLRILIDDQALSREQERESA